MTIDQSKIEQLVALLNGTLEKGLEKELLAEIAVKPKLSNMHDMLKEMHDLKPKNSNQLISAAKKLSQSLYKDFLKQQKASDVLFGVQVFDSSLLPLPEGVRPASVDTRQLKYKIGNGVVELSTYPITVDSVEIIGKINDIKNIKDITITARTGHKEKTVNVDEVGMFRFDRVETNKCKLTFSFIDGKEAIIELDL